MGSEPEAAVDWQREYQEQFQAILDHIKENDALSSRDRVLLLDTQADTVKAALRDVRTSVRSESHVVSVSLDGQAKKILRHLQANGKDPRSMSDSDLLKIGDVGTKTLEAIRLILEGEPISDVPLRK